MSITLGFWQVFLIIFCSMAIGNIICFVAMVIPRNKTITRLTHYIARLTNLIERMKEKYGKD